MCSTFLFHIFILLVISYWKWKIRHYFTTMCQIWKSENSRWAPIFKSMYSLSALSSAISARPYCIRLSVTILTPIAGGEIGILLYVVSYLALGAVPFACQYEWSAGSKVDRLNVILFSDIMSWMFYPCPVSLVFFFFSFLQRYHSFTCTKFDRRLSKQWNSNPSVASYHTC